ncbi:MAG: hypothetical protein V3S08_11310 [Phycisphaerales bacterium]
MRRWPFVIGAVVVGSCIHLFAGCASRGGPLPDTEPDRASAGLLVTAHAGGTHYRTLTVGGYWYQTWGRTLLVVDPDSGAVIRSIELAPVGASGPASDMTLVDDGLFVVLERTEVVMLSVADPGRPRIEYRVGHAALGVEPTTLSVVDDQLYVSGGGGVVRWSDRTHWLLGMECGTVVESGVGLVACSGRRVHRLDDTHFVGSATALYPMPQGTGRPGRFVFVRAGGAMTSVGLMTGRIREVNMKLATVEVRGIVRCVRVFDDRLWVVTDRRIAAYPISGDHLLEPVVYPIAGARDLDFVADGAVAIVGTFGRATVRFDAVGGVHTLREHREPAGLLRARCDGRFVQAGGSQGWWQYEPSGRVTPLAGEPGNTTPPSIDAATIAGRASISTDGVSVILPDGSVYTEPDSSVVSCIEAVDGQFWIGHARGITVLDGHGRVIDRLRLAGPVRYVFPLANGTAAWVSESGGFGTALATDRGAGQFRR